MSRMELLNSLAPQNDGLGGKYGGGGVGEWGRNKQLLDGVMKRSKGGWGMYAMTLVLAEYTI